MLRLSAIVLSLCALPLMAASPPRVLAWDDEVAARKLALVAGEGLLEIKDMSSARRTGPLRIKGAGPLVIRALDKPAGADGKPAERACAVPENVEKPLLVLLPDETHATGIRVLVVDDNPNGFRWGTYRFLNATPKELIVQLEQKAVRVPTGWKITDLSLGGDNRGVGARIALAESIEKPIYTAVWEHNNDIRTLCFLVPGTDPRLSPVAFKSIPEDKVMLQLEGAEEAAKKDG